VILIFPKEVQFDHIYIADLCAATQMGRDIKIFRMNRFGIPQDRIAKKMGVNQASIHNHLLKVATLPNLINGDFRVTFRLSRGFTVAQVAQKHGWTDPLVWSFALEGKNDHDRFKELGWGFCTWDNLKVTRKWEWNDCDKRFGDDWSPPLLFFNKVPQRLRLVRHKIPKNELKTALAKKMKTSRSSVNKISMQEGFLFYSSIDKFSSA